MSTVTKLLTADDLWRMPNDGFRRELVAGELRTMSPSNIRHGDVEGNVTIILGSFVKKKGLGRVVPGDVGFVIAKDPDTVRAPDVAFISKAKIPVGGFPEKFWVGQPDLAIEIVSPSDTLTDVEEKVHQWLAAGTSMVWVVQPRRRSVTVYRTPASAVILTADQQLDGQDVIPGFACQVSEFFD